MEIYLLKSVPIVETIPAKNPRTSLELNHIVPWSKGGETTIENLQTLCQNCDRGKSNQL